MAKGKRSRSWSAGVLNDKHHSKGSVDVAQTKTSWAMGSFGLFVITWNLIKNTFTTFCEFYHENARHTPAKAEIREHSAGSYGTTALDRRA